MGLVGFVVKEDGSSSAFQLQNLSYDGCGILCDLEFRVGEFVRVSVMNRGMLKAEVRWFEQGRAGLLFGEEGAPCALQKTRRFDRILVNADIHMRRPNGTAYRVRVYDVSPEGCGVDDLDRYRPNESVWIRFEGLEPLETKLQWRSNFRAGLRFVRPIHPAVFELLARRLKLEGKLEAD